MLFYAMLELYTDFLLWSVELALPPPPLYKSLAPPLGSHRNAFLLLQSIRWSAESRLSLNLKNSKSLSEWLKE